MTDQQLETRARDYLAIQREGLQGLSDSLGESLAEAVEQAATASKILICGVGKSWHIGRKIAATFTSTGTTAIPLHAAEARHGDLGLAQAGDLAIVISFSGESEEIRELTALLKQRGLSVVALTRCGDNWLGRHADICLHVPVQREACRFNLAPTTSSLVTLALGDLLAILVSERRGFTQDDFAALHPAGAIGHSLRPVREIMRRGERLAAIPATAPLREALITMTTARGGAVVATDPAGAVIGILTDGDVRRHLANHATISTGAPGATNTPNPESSDPLNDPVTAAMTPNPVSIRSDATVADAWDLFRTESIDDLIVVEPDGTLAGLLDLQDLPKLKHF